MESGQVISVHEYELKRGVAGAQLEDAFREAAERGLFELTGLVGYRLVRGIKGARRGKYAALWVYESRETWERLWGKAEEPLPKENYPQRWRTWEEELLGPLLSQEADEIRYTSYVVLEHKE